MVDRVTGLISGLDTESLVKQMMALSQNRYDNIMKKKTETEWKKQLYDDIYAELKSFDDKLFNASLSSFNSPKTVTIGNDALATVSAGSNAANVSHSFRVESLASIASMGSSKNITTGTSKDTIGEQLGLSSSGDITLTIASTDGSKSETFTVNTADSISVVAQKITEAGKAAGIDVKATYDTNTDRFIINSTNMGQAASFDLTGSGASGEELMNALNLGSGGTASAVGKDAIIELDGTTFNFDKNDFSVAGLTFSLKSTSPAGQYTSLNVKADTTKLLENVKEFVKTYNDLIELINGKTSEKYYRDYDPLTDEQRKEMTEKEVELWEEKAKSGLLRNDTILTGLASKMRTAMYSSYNLEGSFKTMSSIGISTKSYQDRGKLTIDEEKLTKALEEDPDAVAKLFSSDGGLVDTLRGDIKTAMREMEDKSGAGKTYDSQSPWAKAISKYSDQLDALSAKMIKEENRYYTQFATLEKTMASMNSSASYLTSMFGS